MATRESRRVRDILDRARADFDDMVHVAFIGARHSGKTVHYALLKDAAAKRLMRRTRGLYLAVATAGGERIDRIVDGLYSGSFPEKTAHGGATPLAVEIAPTKNGSNLALIFCDGAGEEYCELLAGDTPVERRIQAMVDAPGIDGKPYGLMTHLIFAGIYIVVIDCSTVESRRASQAYARDAIRSIYGIKKHIRDLYNDKMAVDVAFVFSKCDTLGDDKGVGELADELPEVWEIVKECVGGDVECFESRVESTGLCEGEEKVEGIRPGRLDEPHAGAEGRKAAACRSALGMVASRREAERSAPNAAVASDPDAAGAPGGAGKVRPRQAAHGKAGCRHEEPGRGRSRFRDGQGSARAETGEIGLGDPTDKSGGGGCRYRPASPLSYNTDEYLDMITWMIKRANRAARC